MLYENIISDSAYVSKEIFFVTSPTEEMQSLPVAS